MKLRAFVFALSAVVLAAVSPAKAADVICYNCPPEWADWASMVKAIKTDLNIGMPHDNKNSGQALAQIAAGMDDALAGAGPDRDSDGDHDHDHDLDPTDTPQE